MTKTPSTPLLLGALAFTLATLFTACQSAPTRTAADLTPLQGYWEGRGPGGDCSVTISGNSLLFHAREDFWFETTFILPAGTDPQQLECVLNYPVLRAEPIDPIELAQVVADQNQVPCTGRGSDQTVIVADRCPQAL